MGLSPAQALLLGAAVCTETHTELGGFFVTTLKKRLLGSSLRGPAEMNVANIHEDAGLIPGLTHWVKDQHYHVLWCGLQVWLGSGSDLALLWRRLVAAAPIRPLAWEPPCATCAALKDKKKKRKKERNYHNIAN